MRMLDDIPDPDALEAFHLDTARMFATCNIAFNKLSNPSFQVWGMNNLKDGDTQRTNTHVDTKRTLEKGASFRDSQ